MKVGDLVKQRLFKEANGDDMVCRVGIVINTFPLTADAGDLTEVLWSPDKIFWTKEGLYRELTKTSRLQVISSSK